MSEAVTGGTEAAAADWEAFSLDSLTLKPATDSAKCVAAA
jgi:hypothetical protein